MRARLRHLFLAALATDAAAERAAALWTTRCLHCRTRLVVGGDGTPQGAASLEHIVPQAWFGRRAAAGLVARVGGTRDDPRNLAIACRRCNHDKGKGPDRQGPADARARAVVGALLDARLARWREPCAGEGRAMRLPQ